MNVRSWMVKNKMTVKQMAEFLDCSQPTLIKARMGRHVGKRFARQLERASKGEITYDETMNPTPLKEQVVPITENEGAVA